MLIHDEDARKLFQSKEGQVILAGLVKDWLKAHPGLRMLLERQENVKGKGLEQGTLALLKSGLLRAEIRFNLLVWHRGRKRYQLIEKDKGSQGK